MLKQRQQIFVTLFVAADAIAVAGACYASWAVRVVRRADRWPNQWEDFIKQPLVLFAVPMAIFAMSAMRLYRPRRDRSIWGEQGQILKAVAMTIAGLVMTLWFIGSSLLTAPSVIDAPALGPWGWADTPAKVQIGWLAIFLVLFLGSMRAAFRLALRYIRRRGWNLRHVAIIGTGRLGQITCRTLSRNSWTGINVAYFISHHPRTGRKSCLNRSVLGGLDDLEDILERRCPDAVYLSLPSQQAGEIPAVLRRLERFAVDVRIVPDVNPRYMPHSMTVSELEGMPILSYRECPLYGLGGFTKRALDLAGASIAILLFSPLMLAVAALIRLSGPGPVIFRQRRVSLGGEVFNIYKFRTMAHADDERSAPVSSNSDQIAGWTLADDPRVTPLGRWLRKTSIDELPQLFNVLRGDMSLVGPRPERPELIARFRDDWRGYMLRQHVKAGMTGWAQVNGLRGQTSLRKRLQYDLFYIRHWSLWFDVRILLMTIYRGFIHRNAI
ncbi:MAG: undecaprenyl-phosphate glucose phosphotransferase [Phycisphaeraceae bacterium]|nr:undecaprenyl-phosphate glucose phosphotransferase [Phycisphaeraceae bacterium]